MAGPNTGCFSRWWQLFGARKLVAKKLKDNFFPRYVRFFKGSCTLLHCFYVLSNFKSCETWYFYSFYFHKHTPIYPYLWVLDHSHDHISSYYRRLKKFSVLLPEWDVVKDEKFWGRSLKNPIFRGAHEKPLYRGDCLKKGELAGLKGGLAKKRGWCFWEGGWYPNAHYVNFVPK